jgi:hypothetical protein
VTAGMLTGRLATLTLITAVVPEDTSTNI